MPIFEYFCKKCEKEFEELVLNKEEKIYCPTCESSKVERLMSKAAFRTKGKTGSFSSSVGGGSCSSCSATSCSSCSSSR